MSELTERLAEALAVCDAATEGPWEAFGSTIGAMTGPGDCGGCSGILSPAHEPACYWSEIAGAGEADAEFIARARTGYPVALRALQAVLELHRPFEWSFGYGPVTSCKGCADQGVPQEKAEWPCPTVRAIREVYGHE